MSLVNDMLRDLDARRAVGEDRASVSELRPTDEPATRGARASGSGLRKGALWLLLLAVLGILAGLGAARFFGAVPVAAAEPVPIPAPAVAPTPTNRLLDVLPQNDGKRFVLQLLLDQTVAYRRLEENGSVRLSLRDVQLANAEPVSGHVQRDGASLAWRVEQKGNDVQLSFVGLAGDVQLIDRLERAGDRWQLWLEIPLASEQTQAATEDELPAATAAVEALPDWTARDAARPEPTVTHTLPPAAVPTPVAAPQVSIASHRPDPLTEARQALLHGDNARAVSSLEALNKARPEDAETARWLARAYLASGNHMQLLAWLPSQLQRFPNDAELRVLLARSQLQGGDGQAAVTTLQTNPPPLAQDPTYHALLAAAYQQTGQWQESASRYQLLLAVRPREGTWLLGLAIALDQLGQQDQAAGIYDLAQQSRGLDDNTRRFAAERARVLGGKS
jgi:MSHA biogenesis protein MshN